MKLFFEQSGAHDDAILFVHGFPFDHTMWNAQRFPLSNEFRAITPDLRGLGKSPLPPDAQITRMSDFADDAAELLDELKIERVTICGLSMGGYIAFEFWKRHADRLKSLILCDTNADPDPSDKAAQRYALARKIREKNSLDFIPDATCASLLTEKSVREQDYLWRHHREMVVHNNPSGVAAAACGMAERADFSKLLPEIRVPTLVLVGEFDVLSTPARMKALADTIPGAQFVQIPDAAHLAPMENPAAVNNAIRTFMKK